MKLMTGDIVWSAEALALFAGNPATKKKESSVPVETDDNWIRLHVKKGHNINHGFPNEVLAEARGINNG